MLKIHLYKKAEKIYTLSEGMKEVLTTYGSAENKKSFIFKGLKAPECSIYIEKILKI